MGKLSSLRKHSWQTPQTRLPRHLYEDDVIVGQMSIKGIIAKCEEYYLVSLCIAPLVYIYSAEGAAGPTTDTFWWNVNLIILVYILIALCFAPIFLFRTARNIYRGISRTWTEWLKLIVYIALSCAAVFIVVPILFIAAAFSNG